MTRRQLAGLAGAALAATKAAKGAYTGALDGFESKVQAADFDPVAYTLRLYDQAPRALAFKATSKKQAEAWQKKLRAKVVELVGVPPRSKAALQPLLLESRDFPGYKREKIALTTEPGVGVLIYLLTPKGASGPLPAVVCVPGHGRGVDDIVGIDDKGADRTNKDGYMHDYAIQVAEHGMAAVAIEPMAFGCRRDPINRKRSLGQSACQPTAGAALLLGQTMIGWRVRDVMRTIDWIETRKDLDAKRVGCVGISGGGTCTLFAAAVDERIQAALVSGYLNSFKASIVSLSHCIDNYVPGILNHAEMSDVAALIAPRALFAESGEKDNIFPIDAFKQTAADVKRAYTVFGAADRFDTEVHAGAHVFHGVKGLPFLKKSLAG